MENSLMVRWLWLSAIPTWEPSIMAQFPISKMHGHMFARMNVTRQDRRPLRLMRRLSRNLLLPRSQRLMRNLKLATRSRRKTRWRSTRSELLVMLAKTTKRNYLERSKRESLKLSLQMRKSRWTSALPSSKENSQQLNASWSRINIRSSLISRATSSFSTVS